MSIHKNSGNLISSTGLDLPLQWKHIFQESTSHACMWPLLLVVLSHLKNVQSPRTLIVWVSLCLPANIVRTCFNKNMVWAEPQRLCWWLNMCFFNNRNASWCTKQTHFAMSLLFCLLKTLHGVYRATGSYIKLDALKKISVATFCISGLTKMNFFH